MIECFIIVDLPPDAAQEYNRCKYQIHHVVVEREETTGVWVKRMFLGADLARMTAYRVDKYLLDKYGRFSSIELAQKKVHLLLQEEIAATENKLDYLKEQVDLFLSEKGK